MTTVAPANTAETSPTKATTVDAVLTETEAEAVAPPEVIKGQDEAAAAAAVVAAVEAAATAEVDAATDTHQTIGMADPNVADVTPLEENEELRRMISELKDQLKNKDSEIVKLKEDGGNPKKRKKPRLAKLNEDGTPGTPSKKMEVQKQKRDTVWKARYDELVAYKLENGDTNVPTKNYKPNPQLAHWVHTQRTRRRAWDAGKAGAGDLTQERIDSLDLIGFQWNPGRRVNDDLWEQRFNELCEFKRENGHTNVPEKYAPNKSLGKWVSNQRHRRKLLDAGKKAKGMTRTRVEKLDAVGFEWTK